MTSAFMGGYTVKRGDGATPTEVFATIEEINDIPGIGSTRTLLDTTNFDSGNNMEYIGGLKDGNEISITANHVLNGTVQQALINDIDTNVQSRNIEITITNGTTTATVTFAVVPLSWNFGPSVNDKNTIVFTLKITGAVSIVYS